MKNSNSLRVFFAVVLPNTVYDSLFKSLETLKKEIGDHSIRWMPIHQLHVTLQFLKRLQKADLASLIELVRVQLKNISDFQLHTGILTTFPTSKNPGILALTVEPHTVLMTLSNIIGQAMDVLGYPVETRPFQGHITLARLQHDKLQIDLFSPVDIPPMLIQKIYLIESRPDQAGSHYIPIAQFELNHNKLNP